MIRWGWDLENVIERSGGELRWNAFVPRASLLERNIGCGWNEVCTNCNRSVRPCWWCVYDCWSQQRRSLQQCPWRWCHFSSTWAIKWFFYTQTLKLKVKPNVTQIIFRLLRIYNIAERNPLIIQNIHGTPLYLVPLYFTPSPFQINGLGVCFEPNNWLNGCSFVW